MIIINLTKSTATTLVQDENIWFTFQFFVDFTTYFNNLRA